MPVLRKQVLPPIKQIINNQLIKSKQETEFPTIYGTVIG